MNDFDELERLFAIHEEQENNIIKNTNKELCCDNPDIEEIDGYNTCIKCGLFDVYNPLYQALEFDERVKYRKAHVYKRFDYMRDKLKLISGIRKYPMQEPILKFMRENKGKKYDNIKALHKHMKKENLAKYYKYIYSVYEEITGEKIIDINYDIIEEMGQLFVEVIKAFAETESPKNMYSYDILIYYFMKYKNIKNYDKMILPGNFKKATRKIDLLLDTLGMH